MDHDVFIPAGAQWRPGAHDRLCSLPRVTICKPLLSTLNPDVDLSHPGLSRIFPHVAQEVRHPGNALPEPKVLPGFRDEYKNLEGTPDSSPISPTMEIK